MGLELETPELARLLGRCEELAAEADRALELAARINDQASKRDELWQKAAQLKCEAQRARKGRLKQQRRLCQQADELNNEVWNLYLSYQSVQRHISEFAEQLLDFAVALPEPIRSELTCLINFPRNNMRLARRQLRGLASCLKRLGSQARSLREQFSEWCRVERIKTQQEAAQRIGISRSTLKRILAGQSVSSLNLVRFVEVTGLGLELASGKPVKRLG